MTDEIVHSSDAITLVGGGEATRADLDAALALAPRLVAADGGALLAVSSGRQPEAVIGDMDSLSPKDAARLPPGLLHRIAEQDSTDFDKAMRSISAPLVLGVGFLGGRVDHQLAALSTLVRFAHQPCVLLGRTELVFVAPPRLSLDLAPGDVVSLYPLQKVTGRSTGLEWPIDGLTLSPDGQIGTSNRAKGVIDLTVDAPGLVVIVPRTALGGVTRALGGTGPGAPSRWPARA